MGVLSGLTAILSIGIAFSLMVGVSGCVESDNVTDNQMDNEQEDLSVNDDNTHTSIDTVTQSELVSMAESDLESFLTEAPGMAEDDFIYILEEAGFYPMHYFYYDDYSNSIAKDLILSIVPAGDAGVIYYGLSKGSEDERLEEINAGFDEWKAELENSINDYYQEDPWYNKYWTVTGFTADLNTDDIETPYLENFNCCYCTPEGYEAFEDEIIWIQYWISAGISAQYCMVCTDNEGNEYLRSTDYIDGFGIVDIVHFGDDYSTSWYVASNGQPLEPIITGYIISDELFGAEPWSQY